MSGRRKRRRRLVVVQYSPNWVILYSVPESDGCVGNISFGVNTLDIDSGEYYRDYGEYYRDYGELSELRMTRWIVVVHLVLEIKLLRGGYNSAGRGEEWQTVQPEVPARIWQVEEHKRLLLTVRGRTVKEGPRTYPETRRR
ncbi:hypothetical protein BDZ89DRAFT_1034808 [Hymenopellis radicata]|nr:hypothetical protein BDZ89DRAFT_1034808 [Hymenopellis radicata]